jgi:hypothetical protein
VAARPDVWWRQKAAFNIGLARLGAIAPLDPAYNAQVHVEPAAVTASGMRRSALWRGIPAKILHFNGCGRSHHAAWKRALLDS